MKSSSASASQRTEARVASGWSGGSSASSGSRPISMRGRPLRCRSVATNATSSSPARSSPSRSCEPDCTKCVSTRGWRRWKRSSRAAMSTSPRHCSAPIRSDPARSRLALTTASRAPAACSSIALAYGSSANPASVGSTRRVVRMNRLVPSSSSRARIAADRPDCEMPVSSAARVKLLSSASATRYSIWRRSTNRFPMLLNPMSTSCLTSILAVHSMSGEGPPRAPRQHRTKRDRHEDLHHARHRHHRAQRGARPDAHPGEDRRGGAHPAAAPRSTRASRSSTTPTSTAAAATAASAASPRRCS